MHLCSSRVLEHEYIESAFVYTGTYYPSTLGSGPSTGTQDSATQDPHIAASDSSSDFDVMEGYLMQQHPESSSQDMHALDQQPSASMFSRLKETLSRATRSEHATTEINKGSGEVDLPFTSQIDPVHFESFHVSTPTTTPIGPLKLTPSETLLPDGMSLAKMQEVERYILAVRKKEIESLRKAEQHQAILVKALMKSALSANPLQSPKLTTLKSQTIGSHIASTSRDTPNTSILDGVFLNENWEYNLQAEKLTDLYTSYTYHVVPGTSSCVQPLIALLMTESSSAQLAGTCALDNILDDEQQAEIVATKRQLDCSSGADVGVWAARGQQRSAVQAIGAAGWGNVRIEPNIEVKVVGQPRILTKEPGHDQQVAHDVDTFQKEMQEVFGLMKNLSVHMMGGGRGQGYGYGCGYGSNEGFAGGRGRGMAGRGDMFQCYNCGEWGHKSPQCDKPKRMGGDMFPLPSQIPSHAQDYGIEIKGEAEPSGLTAEEKGKTKL
ncbi:hypothetical protein L7F22_057957 [Adiantum nelumboides]|nr:hypothetical protein [Adiantum nelumboides]